MLKLKCNIYANRSVKFSDKIGSLLQHKNSFEACVSQRGMGFPLEARWARVGPGLAQHSRPALKPTLIVPLN